LHTCAVKMYAVSNFTRSAIYQPLGNTTVDQPNVISILLLIRSADQPDTIIRWLFRRSE